MKASEHFAQVELARAQVQFRLASLHMRQFELGNRLGRVHPALLIGAAVAAGALIGRIVGVPKASTLAAPLAAIGSALQQRAALLLRDWIAGLFSAAPVATTRTGPENEQDHGDRQRGRM